jgi:ParB family transcriptional regulator, chromosome partitioning protein
MHSHCDANPKAPDGNAQAGVTALPSLIPAPPIREISLNQLTLAPGSGRKMSRRSIQLLAERILTAGRPQSLMVVAAEDSQCYVVAGERRLAALQMLLKQGRIPRSFPVPCRVIATSPTVDLGTIEPGAAAAEP